MASAISGRRTPLPPRSNRSWCRPIPPRASTQLHVAIGSAVHLQVPLCSRPLGHRPRSPFIVRLRTTRRMPMRCQTMQEADVLRSPNVAPHSGCRRTSGRKYPRCPHTVSHRRAVTPGSRITSPSSSRSGSGDRSAPLRSERIGLRGLLPLAVQNLHPR